ncbi:GAF domain protein (macronuclear) [Tetrahymena thermophila SB210]|uniref:GAF domain protein n=1 Tax=Tetrahymena thermophila (strain SB210) TaxID=312017 RepID=A4VD13_TETTS|nr:GAF domain protein [Tetrahymena thermophila SB210]EDK31422.2 GAF domain protein [Tetrahymena thermophila SB210]|eukprot:XP_001470996.2 GAF domain protein [Tetrahymena thermophila SB210]
MNKSQGHLEQIIDKEWQKTPNEKQRSSQKNVKPQNYLSQMLQNQNKTPKNVPILASFNTTFDKQNNPLNSLSAQLKQMNQKNFLKKPFSSSQKNRLNLSQINLNEFSSKQSQNNSMHNSYLLHQSDCNQKQILNDFLKISNYSDKVEVDIENLQNCIKDILLVNERLESENRSLKKDLNRQMKMLEFLQISNKQKDSFFQQMVEQNISLKNELDEIKLHKIQLQKFEIMKDMKQPIIIGSPHRRKASQSINVQQSINQQTINKQRIGVHSESRQQITRQQSKNIAQIKQIVDDHSNINNSESLNFIPSSLENQQNSQIQQKSKRNIQVNTLNIQNGSQTPVISSNLHNTPLQIYIPKLNKQIKNTRQQQGTTPSESNEKKNLRPQFIQHSTDHAFYASALDMDTSEKEIEDFYVEGRYIKFLRGHFQDEQNLQKLIYNLEGQTFKYFYESVNSLLSYLQIGMNLILKMKQVIKCIYNLQHKMNISEVFDALSNECISILSCDKSSIFLLDEKSNLFWTKGNKNDMIKLSVDQSGFCGHVAQTGQTINVLDAHLDDRFDKQLDLKNNYRTKSVLCAPIFDTKSSNRVMGVLQVTNKLNQSFFTKDDEGILKVIAMLSENILKNSVFNDERAEFYNSLRSLYTYSVDAIQCQSLQELIETSYVFLNRGLNIPHSKIVIFDKILQQFFTYQNGVKVYFETKEGIVGKVFNEQVLQATQNISENTDFNKMIDIDTQLPVVTIPIIKQSNLQKNKPAVLFSMDDFIHFDTECLGVLQVINSRGIPTLLVQAEKESKTQLSSYETLQRFCKLLSSALIKF